MSDASCAKLYLHFILFGQVLTISLKIVSPDKLWASPLKWESVGVTHNSFFPAGVGAKRVVEDNPVPDTDLGQRALDLHPYRIKDVFLRVRRQVNIVDIERHQHIETALTRHRV